MDYTVPLSKNSGTPLSSTSEYRKLVGKLLYLTNTRPEIGYAVGKLSQFLDCPTDKHFEAAIRVLRYLKGAPALGLMFSAHSDLEPAGYSDSDWGTCSDSKRSISGYCFFLGTSIVSWKSKKQNTVASSSCEAKYRILAMATREAQWLTYILQDLKVKLEKPIAIY
ncbi:uncharacterized protein LOC107645053 [Arachis ipaensis]|uniref:uncharacterized protein LOC107645053 n=1 Tax=Arachis ipaensis TaxID=130454 RepID=UPI0007AF884A|nr:uncharacterized protein LOC107645053 [Arachis ipaensis]XP_025627755.1 uncharacterized protein LOC112720882 [Arachis hypogaea]